MPPVYFHKDYYSDRKYTVWKCKFSVTKWYVSWESPPLAMHFYQWWTRAGIQCFYFIISTDHEVNVGGAAVKVEPSHK